MSGCTTKRQTHEYFFMLQKKIIIRIADPDVVVLAISVVEEIEVGGLWVAFGTGKHFSYTAAHATASSLGADKSRALPAFHAVTYCDLNYQGHGDLKSDLQPSFHLKYQSICYTTQFKENCMLLPVCKLLLNLSS